MSLAAVGLPVGGAQTILRAGQASYVSEVGNDGGRHALWDRIKVGVEK